MDNASTLPVNLDDMPGGADAVWSWAEQHKGSRGVRLLFPHGGKGSVTTTRALVNYAHNKATAMRCRLRGDIPTAQMYEGICERIYAGLPDCARW